MDGEIAARAVNIIGSQSVLIIDGGEDIRRINMLELMLDAAGYSVHTALTLEKACEHLFRHKTDVILLDTAMPDGTGIGFCRSIRKKTNAHILFLSPCKTDAEESDALSAGGDGYLSKYASIDVILALVEAAMRRRSASKKKPFDSS